MTVITMPLSVSGYASDTASFVTAQRMACNKILQDSNALGFVAKGVYQKLNEVFEDCSTIGWDGAQARPVSDAAVEYAATFLGSLPFGIEAPEISAEPDGAITLEWYRSSSRVINISIGPDGWIHYAAIIGTSRRHGTDLAPFGISKDLLILISQVIKA